jgi:hypothetical protein
VSNARSSGQLALGTGAGIGLGVGWLVAGTGLVFARPVPIFVGLATVLVSLVVLRTVML